MSKNKLLNSRFFAVVLSLGLILSTMTPSLAFAEDGDVVQLRLMETTDIHSHVMNYDYFSEAEDQTVGLVKVATLIHEARNEAANSMLFDNGDLIQGNPMADYIVNNNVLDEEGNIHPVYKAMNLLEYDAGNYGNHEFNYGLEFLEQAISGSAFPYVNANAYHDDGDDDPTNDVNFFDPYVILDKEVTDEDGDTHTLKVGVIGFVPPQITIWDKDKLEGKIVTHDLKATAEKFIPQMKEDGADIIIGIAHSGIGSTEEYIEGAENQTYQLSTVDGFDALLFGHSHQSFPSADYAELDGKHNIDLEKGTINGVATTQAGFWGSDLGVIDLQIEKVDGEWTVTDGQSQTIPIFDPANDVPLVEADETIVNAVKDDHEGTKEYVSTPVGETAVPLYSYFAQVLDDPTVQIVSDAQKQYIETYIQGTELDGLPVLSAAAPFKAGRDGVSDYTDIPAGGLAIKDTTSLYKYPNTVRAVKMNGAQVIEWLEWSAGQFFTIDPNSSEPQELVNTEFRSYNFDVIDGITYEIDVTEEPRYDHDGVLINEDSHRIKNVQYNGEAIDLEQDFLIATNNHRAAQPIANPDGDNVVIESPDETRQVLVNYIQQSDVINPKADNNWTFAPIEGDVDLSFVSAPGGQKYAEDIDSIEYLETRDDGYALYKFDLSTVADEGSEGEDSEEPGESEVPSFSDVPDNHWAADYIHELSANDVIKGYGDGNFGTEDPITRGQFAMLITRQLGLSAEGEVPFTDVSSENADEIAAAYENGIINGYSDTEFKPDQAISREEMAAIIIRAYNVLNDVEYEATESHAYADSNSVHQLFQADVNAAHELGLMIGNDQNQFNPQADASRAEAAAVIYRLIK